jgi:ferric-dicitrate binding protein FerR (iron transport regulator)
LRYEEAQKLAAMAQRVSLTVVAVRVMLSRTRTVLRRCIERRVKAVMNLPADLIEAYLDDELDPTREAQFCDWLSADPEHVSHFVREVHLHQSLRVEMQARLTQASATASERPGTSFGTIAAVVRRLLLGWKPAWTVSSGLAACGVLLVGLGFWYFGPTMGQPVLVRVAGIDSFIQRGTEFVPAAGGMALQGTDVLRIGTNASATIAFGSEQTRLELSAGTELRWASLSRGKRFELKAGKIEASVARQRPFSPMIITTPQAEARVLGTRFTLSVTTNATRLDVMEGKVRLTQVSDGTAVAVPALHYALVAEATELAALPQTGTILREWWRGISGKSVIGLRDSARLQGPVDGRDLVPPFELEPVMTNHLGVRFRGYVHPPSTGDYEFWMAGATESMVFFSSGESPADKEIIGWTHGEVVVDPTWDTLNGENSARSAPIPLVAGRKYYIEALVLIEKGEGHLSIAWKRPGAARELLSSEFISPFKPK